MSRPGPGGVTRDPLVALWLSSVAVSEMGDAAWTVALAWTAVHLTTPALAGVIIAAGAVPRALVLLLGGVVADRVDPRRVMIVTTVVRVAILAAAALVGVTRGIGAPLLVCVSVGLGVCDALYGPSASTIGRQLVRPEQLATYAGMSQTLARLGTLAGSAAGGVLVAGGGLVLVALVDAASFAVVAVVLVVWLRPRYPLPRAEAQPVLRSIARGFVHLGQAEQTRTLVIALAGLNLFVGPALSIGVPLRAQEAGWGAASVGAVTGAVALGGVLGSLLMTRWRPRSPATTAFVALGAQAVGIVALGLAGRTATVLAGLAIGVTAGIASVTLSALYVATVDGAYLGRVTSVLRLGDEALMPGATAGFGALAAAATTPVACAVAGAGMGGLALRSWWATRDRVGGPSAHPWSSHRVRSVAAEIRGGDGARSSRASFGGRAARAASRRGDRGHA